VTLDLDFEVMVNYTCTDALDVLCAQLTRDLFAIAKFFLTFRRQTDRQTDGRARRIKPFSLSRRRHKDDRAVSSLLSRLPSRTDQSMLGRIHQGVIIAVTACLVDVSVTAGDGDSWSTRLG